MAFTNYNDAPTAMARNENLPLGWHTLQIIDGQLTYSSGKQRIRFTVACVGPSAPGASFGFRKRDTDSLVGGMSGTVGTSWYADLARSCRAYSHDTEVMNEQEILSQFIGRVFIGECKPDKNPEYRTIGWPARPTEEQMAELTDHFDKGMFESNDKRAKVSAKESETRKTFPSEAPPFGDHDDEAGF